MTRIQKIEKSETHPIDIAVGSRIRHFRLQRGYTQEVLAKKLGVSFQQVQKYETAGNRISASRLYDITQILGVSMVDFFRDEKITGQQESLSEKTLLVARRLDQISNKKLRDKIVQLIYTCEDFE